MTDFTTATAADIALLSCCGFIGNVGAALTGFGQAIIYLLVYQIVDLAGYDGNFKYAIMIQSLSLFSMQPLLLWKAGIREHAHRRVLLLFVPITLISTPLGQLTSDQVPTQTIKAVAGVLVTFVACKELWDKRSWFASALKKKQMGDTTKENGAEQNPAEKNENEDISETVKDTVPMNENKDFPDEENGTDDKKDSTDKFQENSANGVPDSADAKNTEPNPNAENGDPTQADKNDKDPEEKLKFGFNKPTIYTLAAGGASGFLGGMVAIRGPPLIFYFLHPPHPITFTKQSQRATGVVIMFLNVTMRMIFYLVDTVEDTGTVKFVKDDWRLYLSVIVCAIAGGLIGDFLFKYLKDSKDTIRGILAIFLVLCGVSLLISAFA